MRIILASTSPYRKELLARLRLRFEVIGPGIPEHALAGEAAPDLAVRLAFAKAQAVADRESSGLVIGSDQVAELDGTILGKPADRADAVRQLQLASGKQMTLYTGLCVINVASGFAQRDVIPYRVRYRSLSNEQIRSYVDTEEPYGCCGSLKSEGLGISLLQEMQGNDPTALIGLPLIRLTDMLLTEGVQIVPISPS